MDTRPTSRTGLDGIRPDSSGRRPAPGAALDRAGTRFDNPRQRIPTLRQLASLVVNGMLMLPSNYRRGMFLDILV